MINLKQIIRVFDGGEGSGHFEHAGRVGQVGGSTRSGAYKSKQNRKYREGHIDSTEEIRKKFSIPEGEEISEISAACYRLNGGNYNGIIDKIINHLRKNKQNNGLSEIDINRVKYKLNSYTPAARDILPLMKPDGSLVTGKEKEELVNDPWNENAEHVYNALESLTDKERKTIYDSVKTTEAVSRYTGISYVDMRHAYRDKYRDNKELTEEQNKYLEQSNMIDDFIYKSEKFKGELHRGMKFYSPEDVQNVINKLNQGKTVDMQGLSSWSSDGSVANDFGEGYNHIIFHVENKSGASIQELSNIKNEDEVLMPTTARFKLKAGSKPKRKRDPDGMMVYEVYLEEI